MEDLSPTPREVILQVMLMITLVDGKVSEDELTRMRWVAGRLGGEESPRVSDMEVRAAVERASREDFDLDRYLRDVAPLLHEDDKRRVLKAAFVVACADGRVVDKEDAMLGRIARALGISPAAYRATLRHMGVGRDVL